MISWLSKTYQKLTTGRVSGPAYDDFCAQYESVLSWMDLAPPPRPGLSDTRSRLEFISDAVHRHRQAAGVVSKDHGLLPPAPWRDRPGPKKDLGPGPEIILALDGIRSLFNVGSIFRVCDGAGVRSVILGNTVGKEDPRVRKTAMGSHEWICQESCPDLGQALLDKKALGYRIVGLETLGDSIACHRFSWPPKMVLVLGNEEYGISSHVLTLCDGFVHIPMMGQKNSLNVASAAAVALFQARLGPGFS